MKKIYEAPKVEFTSLNGTAILAGSLEYGGQGQQGAHGDSRFNKVEFWDEEEDYL